MDENDDIKKAIQELKELSGDDELRRKAELRLKAIRDEHAALSLATKRGIEQGLQQGIERGIEQGLQQGLEKGLEQGIEQNKVETAKNMLKENMNIELIEKITGLKQDEIEKIKKTLDKNEQD